MFDRNLLNPGDIRSRNNYPRTVQKSPAANIDTIEEEDDEEHVTKLLVIAFHSLQMNPFSSSKSGQTLTPIITQMIRSKSILHSFYSRISLRL